VLEISHSHFIGKPGSDWSVDVAQCSAQIAEHRREIE
jgi:hypothetical protein